MEQFRVLQTFGIKEIVFGTSTLALVSYLLLGAIYNRYFHPLSQFPGPFWGSITNFHQAFKLLRVGSEPAIVADLHRRYGPVVRRAPNSLMWNDAAMISKVYHTKAHKGDGFYNAKSFGCDTPSVLHVKDPVEHAIARKRLQSIFTVKAVAEMQPILRSIVDEWITISKRYADEGTIVNWYDWVQAYSFDITANLIFGSPLGFVRTESDVEGFMASSHQTAPFASFILRIPWLVDFIADSPLGPYIMPTATDKRGLGLMIGLRDRMIQKRINNPTDAPDILNSILALKNPDGTPLDQALVKSELLILLMGGNETTAGSLASFLINIIKFPHVYAKLMAPDGDFSRENLALPDPQFPYLAAVIRESNRWTPPAPGYFPRVISKGGIATRDGRFIPEGTEVVMNFKMCMWDKAVWGEDADEFVPERWLDERAHASEMNNLVYGYGPSKCIGMHLADQMLLIATRAMLENFVFDKNTFVNPEKPFTRCSCYLMNAYEGLYVKLRKREGVV